MAKPRSRKTSTPEASEEISDAEIVLETPVAEAAEPDAEIVVAEQAEPEADAAADELETAVEEALEPVAPAAPEVMPRRGGFMPLVLGGVIAAGLGVGATIYALPYLPAGLLPQPEVDIAALKTTSDVQATQISDLSQKLADFKVPAPDLSGVEAALAELGAQQAANAAAIADLTARISVAGSAEGAANPALSAEVGDLRTKLEAVIAENERSQQEAATAAQAIQAEAQAKAARTMIQADLSRLNAALEAGEPLAPIAEALAAAGVAIPAALSGEIASASALQEGFGPAARSALKSARLAGGEASIGERIGSFLLAQTGVRSLGAKEGDGPDAILSRAQAAVNAKDFGAALAEISALPEAAQPAFTDWAAQATARIDAVQAAAALVDSLK